MDDTTILVICWGLFAVLIFWTWFPALIARMGGTQFSYFGPTPIPDPDPLPTQHPDYEFWATQLRELDYEVMGDVRMQLSYVEAEWRVTSWIRVFQSRTKSTFVFLQRLPSPFNLWRGVEFITYLADDGLLVTKNLPSPSLNEDENYLLQGMDTFVLQDLEAYHLNTLDELRRAGRRPDSEMNLELLLLKMEERGKPLLVQESKQLAGKFLSLHSIIHAMVSLPFVFVSGFGDWKLALGNIVLLVIMRVGEGLHKNVIASQMRDAIRVLASRTQTPNPNGNPPGN